MSESLPEVWGGIECTINRVGDRYFDQLDISGFYNDPVQLGAVLGLGLKALRFPLLWEKHQPENSGDIDFSWASEQLALIRDKGVEPIIGLLHHGSGPRFTNLLDPDFPYLFAAYAGKVAKQFPWLVYFTPVNEPLTTARFSGLYGHWFPHHSDELSFFRMLLNQLKGTVLAMREIRGVIPDAQLIQTEDLGKTYSTGLLKYQATFENRRRWLTYDVLCGRVNNMHFFWRYMTDAGINESELQFFLDNPWPPDILGVNHYVTSERYLDERICDYPPEKYGGNGIHQYADVEAARIQLDEPHGLEHLIDELWERFHIPLAITEAHLHCTREDQLRWLQHVYEVTVKAKRNGVDVRAFTAWSLLGCYGWNRLLNTAPFEYESGAFDISTGSARRTATANFLEKLTGAKVLQHPVLNLDGWWRSESRLYFSSPVEEIFPEHQSVQPVLIIGKSGTLGQAIARCCKMRNIHHVLLSRAECDIACRDQLQEMILRYKPWAIINAAGYVRVDDAEAEPDLCFRENYIAVQHLANLCAAHEIRLVTFSTDLVFDGNKKSCYGEEDEINPLNVYGKSKALAEAYVINQCPTALVIRTAAFFGPWDKFNFVSDLLSSITNGKNFTASDENYISPTYVPHLANATLDLLIDDASGIWHLANKGDLTWYQFARKVAGFASLDESLVLPAYKIAYPARRPERSSLRSTRYGLMPTLDQAVKDYFSATRFFQLKDSIQSKTYESV